MRIIILLLVLASQSLFAQHFPANDWQAYQQPEQGGFSSTDLDRAKSYYDSVGFASCMIVHRGAVVASWGENTRRFMLASARKSLMNAMIGIAVDRGQLTLKTTLAELDIDDLTPLTPTERSATLSDLLSSRAGIYLPAAFEFKAWKERKPARGSHAPGTFWYYNNWEFNVLCTIFEKVSGRKFFQAFEEEIAQPIGMQDFRLSDGLYAFEPETQHPAYLFKMSSRDLARFGLLYLNKGNWQGKQIVPASWVDISTRPQAMAYQDSYGYLWWTSPLQNKVAFTASGAGVHMMTVIPELDLVLVVRTNDYTGRPIGSDQAKQLFSLILNAKQSEAQQAPTLRPVKWQEEMTPASLPLPDDAAQLTGDYQHPRFGTFTVAMEADQLLLLTRPARFQLIRTAADEYYVEDMAIPAVFLRTEEAAQQYTCQMDIRPETETKTLVFYLPTAKQ